MKRIWKRGLSAVLSVVLLLSCVSAMNTSAEAINIVYDFDYTGHLEKVAQNMGVSLVNGGSDLFKYDSASEDWILRQQLVTAMDGFYGQTSYGGVDNGEMILNYKFAALDITQDKTLSTSMKVVFRNNENHKGILSYVLEGDWYAFWIQTPTQGTYDVKLNRYFSKFGVEEASVHILSVDAGDDLQAAVNAALETSGGYAVSYYKSGSGYASSDPQNNTNAQEEILLGQWEADGKSEHLLVFKADKLNTNHIAEDKWYNCMYPSKLTLTRTDSLTAGEILETLSPVSAATAAKEAVFTAEAELAYVCEVDGSDYMFILMNSYKMLVYNLDTGELVDSVYSDALFMQPRGAVMDNQGYLWVCGLGSKLFRYNVRTGESQAVTFSYNKTDNFEGISNLNVHALTLGDDGNIYFGTSTRGYFGVCDTTTLKVSCISPWLDGDPNDTRGAGDGDPDSHYAGYGGLIVRNGYIYACVEGDQNGDGLTTHFFIKYDIAGKTVVDSVDVTDYIVENAGQYRQVSPLGENYIMLGCNGRLTQTVLIDISGAEMALIDLPGMELGCYGFVAESDGYAYVTGRSNSGVGMYKIDIANRTAQALPTDPFYAGMNAMICRGGGWATIDGEKVIVTYRNNKDNDTVEPIYCDVILENSSDAYELRIEREFTVDGEGVKQGAGNQLRSLAVSADRKYVYVGCYGVSRVAQYDVAAGKVTQIYNTYDEQTDGLLVYDGYLYAGNYSKCTITQVNLETGEATAFFNLKESIFAQYRAHCLTAGDGKVFLGTVPKTGVKGGVLAWYDLQTGYTYVATGDGAENVYYSKDTSALNQAAKYEWRRLSTDEIVTQVSIGGLIPNQTINNMVYKDGLIYGTTTIHGGSGSTPDTDNAKLFVYDVANSKVLATCDLAAVLDGFTTQIQWIDVIAEDPRTPGKFWGVVADTLFSFTFNGTQFAVTEELSLGKDSYAGSGNHWDGRNVIFDDDYMYLTFPQTGVYMVDRNDTSRYWKLSSSVPKKMEMGADGNLYFFNIDTLLSADLQVLPVAQYTQSAVAASVQRVIDDLPEGINDSNREQFAAAQARYDALTPAAQALVDTTPITAAKVYQVGGLEYGYIDDAVTAAAQQDKTVTLIADAEAGDVVLTDGVTLDLNGYTLTADALAADVVGSGFVTDSSLGNTGLLAVQQDEVIFREDNADLPLYDASAGGYRLFDYKLELFETTTNVGTGREKFWFKFHFYTDDTYSALDADAYALVSTQSSGLLITTGLNWEGTELPRIEFGLPENGSLSTDAFAASWATGATESRWLYITVGGLDKVKPGTLTVTPRIYVGGVVAQSGSITYVKENPAPDYGWDADGPIGQRK